MIKVLGLFTILSLLLFWPIFFGKVNLNGNLLVSFYPPYGENLPYKLTGWDQLRIYFPFLKVTLDAFRNFALPFWNPHAFSGHPHLADFQTAVFYPLNVAAMFLGQISTWHLWRITPTILASFFTFLYLVNLRVGKKELSSLAAFFGALTFGFSPFVITWGEEVVQSPHSIVWLPLILWAVDKFLKDGRKPYIAVIAFSWAASLFAGYVQTSIYVAIFAVFYAIFRVFEKSRKFRVRISNLAQICFGMVLGTLISAIQLFPSAELFYNSGRASIPLKDVIFSFLLPIESLVTLLAPDFFGHPATHNFFRGGAAQYYEGILFVGVAALIFAVYAVFVLKKDKLVRFLALFALISASTTFVLPTSKLFLSLPIPFLSTSIANRILFVPAFCLAILAAIGFDRWLKNRARQIFKVIWVLGAIYLLIVFYLLAAKFLGLPYFQRVSTVGGGDNALVSLRNLLLPLSIFVLTSALILAGQRRARLRSWVSLAILILAFAHTFYFSQKYFSFSERQYVFPNNGILQFIRENQGYFRSWGVGDSFLENNFASQYQIFWPEGYDSLNNQSYSEFTYVMQGNRLESYTFRADAGLGRGNTTELIESPRRRLIDLVGVKFVIAKVGEVEVMEENNFKQVFEDKGLAVFENLQVLPRAFLASNYEGPPQLGGLNGQEVEKLEKERRKLIFQKLQEPDFDFRNVLILEKPSPVSAQFGEGAAEIISYKSQEVVIATNSREPKLLFLSDNWYPGWKAQVDGNEVPILRANYTFRAVPLNRGEHEVRLYYDSDIFKLALGVSALGLAGCFLLLFRSEFKKR